MNKTLLSKLSCRTCSHRWYGTIIKTGFGSGRSLWYCAKSGDVRRKDMPVIGTDAQLKEAKGCEEYKP